MSSAATLHPSSLCPYPLRKRNVHHRDTENTERLFVLCFLCALCVSVVNRPPHIVSVVNRSHLTDPLPERSSPPADSAAPRFARSRDRSGGCCESRSPLSRRAPRGAAPSRRGYRGW